MAEYRFDDIAINSTEKKKPVESDKEHYLGLEHLDSGTFKVSRFGSEVAPIGDKLIMKKGDVLFGKRRAYQKKVAIAPFDGIFSAHGMVLRPKEDVIDKDFFPLFIASDYFLDAAIKISVGSLSPTINWRDLKELKFNLPELDEQKKLAEVLWQIVATMESYKKLLAKSDEMVKAKFVEMFGDPVANPKKWEIKTVKSISSDIRYGTSKPSNENGKYIYLRMNNITSEGELDLKDIKYIDADDVELEKCSVRKGDILFNRTNSLELVGKTCVYKEEYPMIIAGYIIRIRLYDFVNPIWFSIYFNTKYMKKVLRTLAKGAINQANISATELQQIELYIPPIELQNQFADFVKKSEESKAAIQASLDSLTKVYKKIIAENLGGR